MDKFNLLVFMIRKLYALAGGKCATESADSAMNQEILLGGHLYLMILKVHTLLLFSSLYFSSLQERLEDSLRLIRVELERKCRLDPDKFDISNS